MRDDAGLCCPGRQAGRGGASRAGREEEQSSLGAPTIAALSPGKGVAKEATGFPPGIPFAFHSCVPITGFFFFF